MLRVDVDKWQQTVQDLRLASLQAPHGRTRERFQALYLIASGSFNATTCAAHLGRDHQTVQGWVRLYNDNGPDSLAYRHTGGRSPLLLSSR